MEQNIMDEVAYLFVDQYENIHGLYSESYKKSEVNLIREIAPKGELALYTVVATLFGDNLDQVMRDAAYSAMDYIAYVDETWTPKDADDRAAMLDLEKPHLDSLVVLMRMASMNGCSTESEIGEIQAEAKRHYQSLQMKQFGRISTNEHRGHTLL